MWPLHERFEQVELAGGELLVLAAIALEAASTDVQDPPFERIPLTRRGRWLGRSRPPQDRTDTRNQLAQFERLGKVVVRPELEPDHAVDRVTFAGKHDDRDVALLAYFAGQVETVFLAEI